MIAVGFFFVTIFHFGTKEEKYREPSNNSTKKNADSDVESTASSPIPEDTVSTSTDLSTSTQEGGEKLKMWKDWLKDARFYKTGLLYMCTRLAINIFQSFLVLYLTDALHFQKVRMIMRIFFFDSIYLLIVIFSYCGHDAKPQA